MKLLLDSIQVDPTDYAPRRYFQVSDASKGLLSPSLVRFIAVDDEDAMDFVTIGVWLTNSSDGQDIGIPDDELLLFARRKAKELIAALHAALSDEETSDSPS